MRLLRDLVTLPQPLLARLRGDRRGVTALEYGLIAALIAVAIIASVRLLGTNISAKFNDVATAIGGS